MCGIAGKLYFDPARPVSPAVIDAMTDRLVHRGPDARGVHIDGATGLGHRRLSIIDLSESANQPMTGPSGVVLTFNGEIYNFKALRSNLEAKGREFRTSSDTEVLLALYEDRGPACVHDLVGMFAFAIWDPRTRTLFCARDRIGQKPFYYSQRPDGFSFASELAALLEDDDVSAEVNATAIHHYLTLHYVPSPETAFEGVSKLPPAHTLTLRDGKLSTERYWRNSFEPKHATSVGELAEEAWDLIASATKLRMVSDVPLGAFLSGGKDSPAIVAAMNTWTEDPVKTFTIGFEEAAFNELDDASMSADFLKCEHREFVVSPDTVDVLPKLVEHHGEPFADPSSIPMYYLSEMARRHVTVALSGDGGDEAFGGYSRYAWAWGAGLLDRLPRPVWVALRQAMRSTASTGWMPPSVQRGAGYAKRIFAPDDERYLSMMCHFTPAARWDLYTTEFRSSILGSDTPALFGQSISASDAIEPIDRYMQYDFDGYLSDGINTKVDIASMMHSLEVRAPFLDHRLVEFAARLPASLKQDGPKGRVLYKKAVAPHVPAAILNRKKRGLTLPVNEWLRGPLRPALDDVVSGARLRERGHFQQERIQRLYRDHVAGRADHGYPLWNLMVLELWMREFVDGSARAHRRRQSVAQ
jgi:asparagine synthase (glutamine-hydrolysing)